MAKDTGPKTLADIMKDRVTTKASAYDWQDLALRIIGELGIPGFKRSAVFKACRDYPRVVIEKALNDTKELCKKGESWKYFFKVLTGGNTTPTDTKANKTASDQITQS
jgi:hypothetical protein